MEKAVAPIRIAKTGHGDGSLGRQLSYEPGDHGVVVGQHLDRKRGEHSSGSARKVVIRDVGVDEIDVVAALHAAAGALQHAEGDIDSDHASGRSDRVGQPWQRPAGAGAEIHDRVARPQLQIADSPSDKTATVDEPVWTGQYVVDRSDPVVEPAHGFGVQHSAASTGSFAPPHQERGRNGQPETCNGNPTTPSPAPSKAGGARRIEPVPHHEAKDDTRISVCWTAPWPKQ